VGTVIFIFVAVKRKDLIIYLPAYVIAPLGYFFIYLQTFGYSFRLIGNLLFLIATLALISAIYYEYFKVIRKNRKITANKNKLYKTMFTLSPITWVIISIQIVFSVLILTAIIMLLKLFFIKRKAKHASLAILLASAFISGLSTVLSIFPLPGAWEFSFVAMIIFGTTHIMFPLIIFLEEKIATMRTRLIQSEERYQLISENANDLITLLSNKYEHEYINEHAYLNILGYSKKDLIGKNAWEIVHPDDIKRITISRKISTASLQEMDGEDKEELRIRHKNGSYVWVDSTSKIFLDNQGEPKVIVISREITEKKAAEELIKEENKRLLELDDLRRELITRVSHELKTPLTSIYAVSQILIKADKKDPIERIWPYLEISHRGSIRLKELVKNLMDTSRFDNKKFELRLLEENLNTIITNCVKELQYLAENRQQIINVNLPKEIILILDKNRFEQVLINILSNAIKNTPINGMIFVDLNESNDYVDIIVKDTGIGITNEEKHMLFQKFGKIERYGKDLDVDIEGAGLGLYISREIVKLHGGEILVNSEGRNKGTTFVVRMLKKRSNDKV
jgi:PAS domain S-box-containing protein